MTASATGRKAPRFFWILAVFFGAAVLVFLVVIAASTATMHLAGAVSALPTQKTVQDCANSGARRMDGASGRAVAEVLCAVATSDPGFLRGRFEWQSEQWDPEARTLLMTGTSAILEYASGRTETITVRALTLHYQDPGRAPILATGEGLARSPSAIPLLKRWASVKITP